MLRTYALIITIILAVTAMYAVDAQKKQRFREIDVERINIIEPDGKTRLVISNKQRSPGVIQRGELLTENGGRTGLLFYNDEGTESGGLISSGATIDGKTTAIGSLTFDQYEQDQTIALQYVDDNGHRRSGLAITDYPTVSTKDMIRRRKAMTAMTDPAEKSRAQQELQELRGRLRLYAGRARDDGASVVSLYDAAGRPRLRLRVDMGGEARIEFVDEKGATVRSLTATGTN